MFPKVPPSLNSLDSISKLASKTDDLEMHNLVLEEKNILSYITHMKILDICILNDL